LEIAEGLMAKMKEIGAEGIPVVVGGVIPKKDIPLLKAMGVREVFPVGSSFDEIVKTIKEIADKG